MTRLILSTFFLLFIVVPALAQTAPQQPPTPEQVDQAVRAHMSDLANASAAAQAMLSKMPDLYRENLSLRQQVAELQKELAAAKKPAAKPSAKPTPP